MNKKLTTRQFQTVDPWFSLLPLEAGEIFNNLGRIISDADLRFDDRGFLPLTKGFPKGDIYRENGNIVIELALAGYSKDQLSVKIVGDTLTVSAVKDEGQESRASSLKRSAFTKTFSDFGKKWDLQNADVSYKDGLLRIVVSRLEQANEALEIEIK